MSTPTLYPNTLDYALGEPKRIAMYRNKDTGEYVKLNYNVVDAEFILSHGIDGRASRSAAYKHEMKADVVTAYNHMVEKII
jgi:hypothetical protein